MTSGTVDMPTTSAPIVRKKRYSARVFQIRAGHADIDAPVGNEVFASGNLHGPANHDRIVRTRHIGEARPQIIVIGADQRIAVHQVDVVFNDNDIALAVERIQAAASVGYDEDIGPEGAHHANGKRDLAMRVALVGMETSFHGDHGHALQHAARQDGQRGRRTSIVGSEDGGVVEHRFGLDLTCQRTESVPKMMPTDGRPPQWA